MSIDPKILVIGGSMTSGWRASKDKLNNLGIVFEFCSWHAQAWRHQINRPPYSFESDALTFRDVANSSVFYRDEDRLHRIWGVKEIRPISTIKGVIFTQPSTERGFFFHLFRTGHYVFAPEFGLTETSLDAASGPPTPLSRATLFEWWRSHQYHAAALLDDFETKLAGVPILISPDILPRKDQSHSIKYRKYHLAMMSVLKSVLQEKYVVDFCLQPIETYDESQLFTNDEYAAPPPDPHHYTKSYVEILIKTDIFRAFLERAGVGVARPSASRSMPIALPPAANLPVA
jgi:hypothetical protein